MSRIYTASFFAKDDWHGEVFSIANRQPRGFGLPRLDLFRPSDLLGRYKRGEITFFWYEQFYGNRLARHIQEIKDWIGTLTGDITLCCWEPDPAECHRKFAADFLRDEMGCEVTIR